METADSPYVVQAKTMQLGEAHRGALLASGISEEVIAERGYWSANKRDHATLLKMLDLGSFIERLPGMVIPIYGPDGEQASAQIRLDLTAAGGQRYVSPVKTERPVTMDVHPRIASQLADASIPLWITEGVKKADAATTRGLCCIAIMGVTMWTAKDKRGNVTALPEWDAIELRERNVYIAFDSDVVTKPAVRKALSKLKTFLEGRGAFVHTMFLPQGEDGAKVGLDDFFAAGHTVDDLYALPQYLGTDQYENPKLLAELNEQLAVLEKPVGSILFDNGKGYQICRPSDLKPLFADRPCSDGSDAITWWLTQSGRRRFGEIVFKPGKETDGDYNLWRGWPLEPKPGDITPFWDFVREVICAGDAERYVYIRKWMAHAVQKPAEMPGTALLFHSVEGTGKGMFMDWFKPIFGRHQFTVTSLDNAVGHFNSHLGEALLVFANEAIWGGDKRAQGRLKALITDRTTDVTAKGKDTIMLDNYKRWVFASNADHPVPVDRTDRRFVVFEVSAIHKGDSEYYKRLELLRDDEHHTGSAALMHDLLQEDITGFKPAADRPVSGLAKYKHMSGSLFEQWLQGSLLAAEIRREFKGHDCYEPWDGLVPKNTVYSSYQFFTRGKRGEQLSDVSFWNKMREVKAVLPKASKAKVAGKDGARTRAVELAPIDDARASFAAYMAEGPEMWEHAEDIPPECEDCAQYSDGKVTEF